MLHRLKLFMQHRYINEESYAIYTHTHVTYSFHDAQRYQVVRVCVSTAQGPWTLAIILKPNKHDLTFSEMLLIRPVTCGTGTVFHRAVNQCIFICVKPDILYPVLTKLEKFRYLFAIFMTKLLQGA